MIIQFLRQGFNALSYLILGLILNSLFSIAFCLTLVGTILASPVIYYLAWEAKIRSKPMVLLLSLITIIPGTLGILLFCVLGLTYFLVLDPIKMMVMGIINGKTKSLDSFNEDFWRSWNLSLQKLLIDFVFEIIGKGNYTPPHDHSDYEFFDYEILDYDAMFDPPKTEEKFNASSIQLTKLHLEENPSLLTASEKDHARSILEFKKNTKQTLRLQKRLEQYSDLEERLLLLDTAINKRNHLNEDLEDIEDECVCACGIQTPVLIKKQYQKDNNTWKAVPNLTFIMDETNMKEWLEMHVNPTHPRSRDSITEPEFYKQRETRYRWHFYQGESQELLETAEKIRTICDKASNTNESSCFSWLPSFN